MDINMLRRALWVFLRPLLQLITNLVNPDIGEEWLQEFRKFLRKEPCWTADAAAATAIPVQPGALKGFLHNRQKNGVMTGHDILKHLDANPRLKASCLGPQELQELIHTKGVALFRSKEFKGKRLFGWKSIKMSLGSKQEVPFLEEDNGAVVLRKRWITLGWSLDDPALYYEDLTE